MVGSRDEGVAFPDGFWMPGRGVAFPDGSAADGQTLSGLGQHSDELIANCD